MSKILMIGDLHMKEVLGYSDLIPDLRISEREEILSKIVKESENCDLIVMMGDQLNGRSNHANTLRRFVEFLERFGDKPIRLLVGNHERFSSGASSLDFLKELRGKDWKIISGIETETIDGIKMVFCPYFTGPEVMDEEHKDWQSASKKLADSLPSGDILFAHHSISKTFSAGISTELFEEVVLPMDTLLSKFKRIVAGHIHSLGVYADGKVLLTGSIFTDCVGEESKSVWKLDASTLGLEEIALPVRPIFKLENPIAKTVEDLPKDAIVKTLITDPNYDIEAIRTKLNEFDGSVVVEQVVKQRDKEVELEVGELTVESLLKVYAKQRNIDSVLLFEGYALIQN